jgi:hypothetical protein
MTRRFLVVSPPCSGDWVNGWFGATTIAAASDAEGHACLGTFCLTSGPILANPLFARDLRDPVALQPRLVAELILDRRNFNLNRGRPTSRFVTPDPLLV